MNLIFASDQNDVIGVNGALPWRQKADIERFKKLTSCRGASDQSPFLIMGRKTYESLGVETLPNRRLIVLGSNPPKISLFDRRYGKVIFVQDLVEIEQTIRPIFPWSAISKNPPIWAIGGAGVYSLLLDKVDDIYWTKILAEVDLPEGAEVAKWSFSLFESFKCVEQSEIHPADEENEFPYRFCHYKRMK